MPPPRAKVRLRVRRRLAMRAEFETLPAEQGEVLRQALMTISPVEREARLSR